MVDEDREKQDRDKLDRLYRALMEPGADGDPPMIQRIAAVVKFMEAGELLLIRVQRALLWVVGLAVAIGTLHEKGWLVITRLFGK